MPAKRFVYPTVDQLIRETAQYWAVSANASVAQHGSFHVALSGGNTPRQLYRYLANHCNLSLPWEKTHLYFGDERAVSPDHADSNYRMVRESLLDVLGLESRKVHRIEGELPPAEAAARYAKVLEQQVPQDKNGWPVFDLVLLGLGSDGHTASLFPHTDAVREDHRCAVENYVDKLNAWRITLSFPAINAAQRVALLVEGDGKSEILHAITMADARAEQFPILNVAPHGEYRWYLDKLAASKLL